MKAPLWSTLTAAPHRLFFLGGALQLILPLFAWFIDLTGQYTDLWSPMQTTIASTWAHSFIMVYSIFIFFIFGFLITVFPRWMNGKEIGRESYIAIFSSLYVGLLLIETGLFFSLTTVFSGLVIFLFGWLYGIFVLYRCFKISPAKTRHYEIVILLALLFGALGIACFAVWVYSDNWLFLELSQNIGFWLYLLPVLLAVSHRMLPFFSKNVIDNYTVFQPVSSLMLLLIGCIAHFSLQQSGLQNWLFIADIPMAGVALLHSIRWQLRRSFKDRLLAVVHMAFFWVFIGLSLSSIQSLILLFNGEYILNKAPLHAISIGFFTSLLVAMASRVSIAHSGRPLRIDTLTWCVFLGIQLAAILRISSDLLFDNQLLSYGFNLSAALLWLICLSIWVIKYVPMYLNVRVDGKKG